MKSLDETVELVMGFGRHSPATAEVNYEQLWSAMVKGLFSTATQELQNIRDGILRFLDEMLISTDDDIGGSLVFYQKMKANNYRGIPEFRVKTK